MSRLAGQMNGALNKDLQTNIYKCLWS